VSAKAKMPPRRLFERADWQQDAACRGKGADMFFIERGASLHGYDVARQICQRCPVREDCLAYAIDGAERFGIWGGLTERERRRLRLSARQEPRGTS
jgi:WhiB family redox-sensing transcriptional regulator